MGARDHDAPDVGPVSSRNYNAEVRAGAACYQPEATAAARYGRRERRRGFFTARNDNLAAVLLGQGESARRLRG